MDGVGRVSRLNIAYLPQFSRKSEDILDKVISATAWWLVTPHGKNEDAETISLSLTGAARPISPIDWRLIKRETKEEQARPK